MKLKVSNKGFGSYYSGLIQVIFGSLPCILRTHVVKILLCKIYTSWLWISCIVLTPTFNFNFSPLRAVVFGIFLILIWALYPAVLSNWTPNHLAELNFSSGEGCEVSSPKIKYSQLLCSVEGSQSDHQTHCKAGREAVMFFIFFPIWKLLCSSWIGDIWLDMACVRKPWCRGQGSAEQAQGWDRDLTLPARPSQTLPTPGRFSLFTSLCSRRVDRWRKWTITVLGHCFRVEKISFCNWLASARIPCLVG